MLKLYVLIVIIFAMFIITPISAVKVTYPPEYYSLGNESWHVAGARVNDFGQYFGMYSELRRQNILLEKQNELIADLIGVLENQSQKQNYPSMAPMNWECTIGGSGGCFGWRVTYG